MLNFSDSRLPRFISALSRAALPPVPSKRHHTQLHITILLDCLLSQSRTLKAPPSKLMAQLRKRRRLFLEAVQKTMLTGALFYLISSYLELMSSLCQRCDGAVNKGGGTDNKRQRGRRRAIETACPVAFQNTKASIRIWALICQDLSSWCNHSHSEIHTQTHTHTLHL